MHEQLYGYQRPDEEFSLHFGQLPPLEAFVLKVSVAAELDAVPNREEDGQLQGKESEELRVGLEVIDRLDVQFVKNQNIANQRDSVEPVNLQGETEKKSQAHESQYSQGRPDHRMDLCETGDNREHEHIVQAE